MGPSSGMHRFCSARSRAVLATGRSSGTASGPSRTPHATSDRNGPCRCLQCLTTTGIGRRTARCVICCCGSCSPRGTKARPGDTTGALADSRRRVPQRLPRRVLRALMHRHLQGWRGKSSPVPNLGRRLCHVPRLPWASRACQGEQHMNRHAHLRKQVSSANTPSLRATRTSTRRPCARAC